MVGENHPGQSVNTPWSFLVQSKDELPALWVRVHQNDELRWYHASASLDEGAFFMKGDKA